MVPGTNWFSQKLALILTYTMEMKEIKGPPYTQDRCPYGVFNGLISRLGSSE